MGIVSRAQNRHLRLAETGLRIRLLGPISIENSGKAVSISSKKARALLGYLVLRQGAEVSRSVLTALLWGERSDNQARASLRQTLSELRSALAGSIDGPIVSSKETISWSPGMAWIDTSFLESVVEAEDDETLRQAAELVGGELMEGLSINETGFEQWLTAERQRFRLLSCRVFARLMILLEHSGKLEEALGYGLKLLSLDPLQEHVHRAVMQIYALQGRYDAALAQYERCRDELSTQLGVPAASETEELVRSIRVSRRAVPTQSQTSKTSSRPENDALATTIRPSIAVLPFANLSGDPGQDYFADGVVEDIISGLTRLHWLFVIAKDSSFTFKDKAINIKQAAQELGVRYLLEGSVRKAGERVRIASQLIEASSGTHIWADHFDGPLSDIFDLQDQITASVVSAIEPKIRHAEIERARRKPTESVDAYDLFLRAVALNNTRKKDDNENALQLLYRAVEIDPQYAVAYGLASYCYLRRVAQGYVYLPDPAFSEGMRMAQLAAEHGKEDPEALWMAGVTISILAGETEDGLALIDRSLALNSNSANALMVSGLVRATAGEFEAAIPHLQRSRQLSPLDPLAYGTSLGFSWVYFLAGRYEEASASCARTLHEAPIAYPPALHLKIACCSLLGRPEEGRKWVERLLAISPNASISKLEKWLRLFVKKQEGLEALLTGMRNGGVPE